MNVTTQVPTNSNATSTLKLSLMRFLNDESGQDLIEYALVAALVGLGAVAAMNNLATSIGSTFNGVGSTLTSAV